jgi:hypothetical protein
MHIFLIIFTSACGGSSSEQNVINTEVNNKYETIKMIVNEQYEVNVGDKYIPENNTTKLQIEYRPLSDSKFITILDGQATLYKIK